MEKYISIQLIHFSERLAIQKTNRTVQSIKLVEKNKEGKHSHMKVNKIHEESDKSSSLSLSGRYRKEAGKHEKNGYKVLLAVL